MSINPGLKKYMIVMSTFVCQVMKFDDLKELGSESAVKVCVPALNNRHFFQVLVLSFGLRNPIHVYCRLLENTSRRGRLTWCRMGTVSSSSSTCLMAGRSENVRRW